MIEPQTQFVLEYYRNKNINHQLFFVDIGAHDGVTINNSLALEDLFWDGICVEPNPNVFGKLRQNRTCQCILGAVSDTNGTDDFLCVTGYSEMLSGLVSKYDPRHLQRLYREVEERNQSYTIHKNIPIFTLSKMIDDENVHHIDYLSIDAEGAEEAILSGVDWPRHGSVIHLIGLEDNFNEDVGAKILTDHGYEKICRIGADNFWRRK